MGYNVAIDGPAGAGKSTIAKRVAKEKGFIYVDTGAMYRGMAIYFLEQKISPDEKEEIAKACQNAEVSIAYEDGEQQIYLNGKNVTALLRKEEVGKMASISSAIPEVRQKLLSLQRNLAKEKDVVMDGRDIGTNILPDADVKVYLTASSRTRANRRYLELREKNVDCNLDEIEREIIARDERDMNREIAPLKQAEDAILIDSSDLSIEEVTEKILELCK
ncbi:cytidylate kinase [Mediterraneibacter butyricigenes]|uniref:Cytidylate kinase n=1 Tax=Mediterraneibacter butyricigenes TaxID=2316025 RepID=A0A391P803_9FIRM|nr:(d)CMP kinase [Mediterraneibacter butyricigenes]RGO28058.1 (d)CMP kinase [Dorea sp. OM02-2LB]GCA65703.1 cytidylate kinase [Mediterraneibacter butyricigenes]